MIEFNLGGTVLTANQKFLDALGYTLAEIKGKHHSLFVEPAYAQSSEYKRFWEELRRGQYQTAQFKRIGKGGKEIWLEASYNPILDSDGKPFKVVKFATDVTAQKQDYANLAGQVAAINKSQAVIEFDLGGTVLTANQKFLDALGYTLAEIKGKHHSLFVEPAYAQSSEYKRFWESCAEANIRRRSSSGSAKVERRLDRSAVQSDPDVNDKPFKVVKFATDITEQGALLSNLKTIVDQNFGEIDGALARSSDQARVASGAVQNTSGNVTDDGGKRRGAVPPQCARSWTLWRNRSTAVDAAEHRQLTGADLSNTETFPQRRNRWSASSRQSADIAGATDRTCWR